MNQQSLSFRFWNSLEVLDGQVYLTYVHIVGLRLKVPPNVNSLAWHTYLFLLLSLENSLFLNFFHIDSLNFLENLLRLETCLNPNTLPSFRTCLLQPQNLFCIVLRVFDFCNLSLLMTHSPFFLLYDWIEVLDLLVR